VYVGLPFLRVPTGAGSGRSRKSVSGLCFGKVMAYGDADRVHPGTAVNVSTGCTSLLREERQCEGVGGDSSTEVTGRMPSLEVAIGPAIQCNNCSGNGSYGPGAVTARSVTVVVHAMQAGLALVRFASGVPVLWCNVPVTVRRSG